MEEQMKAEIYSLLSSINSINQKYVAEKMTKEEKADAVEAEINITLLHLKKLVPQPTFDESVSRKSYR